MRLRIVKQFHDFRVGEIVNANPKFAKFLLKNRYAIQSKDMTVTDYKQR